MEIFCFPDTLFGLLIEGGYDQHFTDQLDETVLHKAVHFRSGMFIKYATENLEVNPFIKNYKGLTALDIAQNHD